LAFDGELLFNSSIFDSTSFKLSESSSITKHSSSDLEPVFSFGDGLFCLTSFWSSLFDVMLEGGGRAIALKSDF
jgi:hypothetical protein